MSTTPAWRVVAGREISTQLRSRAFLISGAMLVLGLVALIVITSLTSGGDDEQKVAVVDTAAEQIVKDADGAAEQADTGMAFEAKTYDDADAAEQAVRDGEADVALIAASDDPADGYELVGDSEIDESTSQALAAGVAATVTGQNAEQQGVDLGALSAGATVSERFLDPDAENRGLREVGSFVFVLLFYITALTFGMAIATNVTQEKESRIVEILAAAVPIKDLLWGKVVGNTVLAMGQTVLLVAAGVLSLIAVGDADGLSALGPAIAWYVVFFVLGFVALASFWSVAGSLASRQQDLQSTTAPLQIILFAPYIIAITAGEGVKTVASMLPIVSTMLMPSRLAEGDVPAWQLGVAIVATVVAAVLFVRLGAKVYERTLLRTGAKISYGEALKSTRQESTTPT